MIFEATILLVILARSAYAQGDGPYTVQVPNAADGSRVKTVEVPSNVECPTSYNQADWFGFDGFDISKSGTTLTIQRKDRAQGWGMQFSLECRIPAGDGPYIVQVGSSGSRVKTVEVPSNVECPTNVNHENWIGYPYTDRFDVSKSGTTLTITRMDRAQGWGMDLRFECRIPGAPRCKTNVDMSVKFGTFVHHADSHRNGVGSDIECRNLCIDSEGCTAWVRAPSINKCWLSKQTGNIEFETNKHRNSGLACSEYDHYPRSCVSGTDIDKYYMSLSACTDLCDRTSKCKAFEYGVDYQGAGQLQKGICVLNYSADQGRLGGCDGGYHNLDLYIKPAETRTPTSAPTPQPTVLPTDVPTAIPTAQPTDAPTDVPTVKPTKMPSDSPTRAPSFAPTSSPTTVESYRLVMVIEMLEALTLKMQEIDGKVEMIDGKVEEIDGKVEECQAAPAESTEPSEPKPSGIRDPTLPAFDIPLNTEPKCEKINKKKKCATLEGCTWVNKKCVLAGEGQARRLLAAQSYKDL